MAIQKIKDFTWWLDLNEPTSIDDNAFSVLKNMSYNDKLQLQTRRWYRPIFDSVGSEPFTSFYNYRNDETNEMITVGFSWTTFYELDSSEERQSVRSNLVWEEYCGRYAGAKVRLDFAPYRWDLYMADGVNPYAKYSGGSYTQIGITSVGACTFDNTTNTVTSSDHWLVDGDRVIFGGTGTLPAEIQTNITYYVIFVSNNEFRISLCPDLVVFPFTDNGSGSLEVFESQQPKLRYLQYIADRMYGGWDTTTPQTLYYTWALPANADNIWGNAVIVWADEGWVISWLTELQQNVIVTKTNKIYAVNVVTPSVDAIDAQWWAYANRVITNVENGLFIYTDRWVDQLQARDGVSGSASIFSEPMSQKVRLFFDAVDQVNYKFACALYIPSMNKFFCSFDSNNDQIPDKTLVWDTRANAWSEFTYPNLYTYGQYETATQKKFLFAPSAWGQLFEMEAWFDDNGADIPVVAVTKNFDFGDPVQLKTFDFVDVSWYKQESWVIEVEVFVDGVSVGLWLVDDGDIDTSTINAGIGITTLGTDTIWSSSTDTDDRLQLYPFNVKIPFFTRGANIQIALRSEWVQWILSQMRVSVNTEPVELFNFWSIK